MPEILLLLAKRLSDPGAFRGTVTVRHLYAINDRNRPGSCCHIRIHTVNPLSVNKVRTMHPIHPSIQHSTTHTYTTKITGSLIEGR